MWLDYRTYFPRYMCKCIRAVSWTFIEINGNREQWKEKLCGAQIGECWIWIKVANDHDGRRRCRLVRALAPCTRNTSVKSDFSHRNRIWLKFERFRSDFFMIKLIVGEYLGNYLGAVCVGVCSIEITRFHSMTSYFNHSTNAKNLHSIVK